MKRPRANKPARAAPPRARKPPPAASPPRAAPPPPVATPLAAPPVAAPFAASDILVASTINLLPQGRLTLTSGLPVTTSDVAGSTLCYYTPATGAVIPIYSGTDFIPYRFTELSNDSTQSSTGKAGPAACGNNFNYFMMVWNDSGTLRLTRSPAWASDTSPGTGAGTAEIEMVNGIWVNKQAITNGPAARRGTIVGGVRSNGAAQFDDILIRRYVSNIYNAVPRTMRAIETTASWNYTLAAFRPANGNAANALDWFHALNGVLTEAEVVGSYFNNTAGIIASTAIGIDGTVTASDCLRQQVSVASGFAGVPVNSSWKGYAGQGRHTATWLEYSGASGYKTLCRGYRNG